MMVVPFLVDRSVIRKAAPTVLITTDPTYHRGQHSAITQILISKPYRSYDHILLFFEKEPDTPGTS